MLDEVGVINMNGRMYDPLLGRFMSADFVIPAPFDLQSYNRYAYVVDNPLRYTDASGQCPWCVFAIAAALVGHEAGIINTQTTRTIIGVAAAAWMGPGFFANSLGGFGSAVAVGGISGGIAGGWNGAAGGAITAGLFYGAGSLSDTMHWGDGSFGRAMAHAAAGCAGASAGGGDCGNGAISAGFSEFAGPKLGNWGNANVIKYAIVGGTASVIGGGKFANGAETAAFGYLFNHVAHNGFTLRNPNVLRNLNALNQKLVNMGYDDAKFELSVTGGDRYRDSEGNIRSATDNSIVEGASSRSPHLYERGARAVDLDVRGVSKTDFDTALRSTQFDPSSTGRDYPNAPHTHVNLYNRKSLYYSPSE
ncbi:MAG: hypothetical protein K2P57_07845 [Burkholderiales bacterium]|nr:hypothetical protein [Burkholderiales bacterium]